MVVDEVLAKVASPELRTYVVWIPVMPEDGEGAARAAASRLRDPRVAHFWDPERALGRALGETLAIPARREPAIASRLAWDVYVLYPRAATWARDRRAPPAPVFWMHQLDQVDAATAPELDGATLRARVEASLREPR